MTYRGHSVLRTLIRCHFSPAETTGAQYLYSGSADGRVHVNFILYILFLLFNPSVSQIWSLDGRIVEILDRSKTLQASFSPSGPEPEATSGMSGNICVRDVSWHSQVSPSGITCES
jgi:WD repeat-containing protein 23